MPQRRAANEQNQRSDVVLAPWPVLPGSQWLEYVNEPQTKSEVAAIRHSCRTGRPYGIKDWVKSTAQRLGLEKSLHSRGNPGKPF